MVNWVIVVGLILGITIFGIVWMGRREEKLINIRPMAVAESFYPADKETLNKQLDSFLSQAEKVSSLKKPRIIIVPHAGTIYSGSTAAFAYKQLEGWNYKKIILLGVSHTKIIDYAAIDNNDGWKTPWGNLIIDKNLAEKILSPTQKIVNDSEVHAKDHNLEMQSIWIGKLFPKTKIVPIMLGQVSPELSSALAFRIAQNMDEETLLIVSSDLSHYPNYETANEVDKQTIESIIKMDPKKFTGVGIETNACGLEAIKIGINVAKLLQMESPKLLKYQNSGDTSGDKSRVVGYGSIVIDADKLNLQVPKLDEKTKAEALQLAKKTLTEYLDKSATPTATIIISPLLYTPLGAFITIKNKEELRGCIGEFEPSKPLYQVIAEKTIAAASRDQRFTPVKLTELPDLRVEISVMTPRQKVKSWEEIRLGIDGVVIQNGNRAGTFLPQVATETGWNRQEFLEQLCSQKAGLPKDCYKDPGTDIFIFQAEVF